MILAGDPTALLEIKDHAFNPPFDKKYCLPLS
jgi:hypothetical protein